MKGVASVLISEDHMTSRTTNVKHMNSVPVSLSEGVAAVKEVWLLLVGGSKRGVGDEGGVVSVVPVRLNHRPL